MRVRIIKTVHPDDKVVWTAERLINFLWLFPMWVTADDGEFIISTTTRDELIAALRMRYINPISVVESELDLEQA